MEQYRQGGSYQTRRVRLRSRKIPTIYQRFGHYRNALTAYEIGSSELEVPNYFANIRTDNNAVLGVVGRITISYQNREAFNFFDAIVGGGEGILV